MKYPLSSMKYLLIVIFAGGLLTSCSKERAYNREIVREWIGREIVWPEELVYQIQDDTVTLFLDRADYKIVNYIDTMGCTPCRMKLDLWNNVIGELKSIPDVEVEVITIVNTDDRQEIASLLQRDNYFDPIAFDPGSLFERHNELPPSTGHHTFLLDSENKIVAIGNPAVNPKIKDLFLRYIADGYEHTTADRVCNKPVRALGVVRPGDMVTKAFYLGGSDTASYTIQAIVPSCDCVSATAEVIPKSRGHKINVTYNADSTKGAFSRYVDVFFHEKEAPERLIVYGYIN